jgi:hypothetical protein
MWHDWQTEKRLSMCACSFMLYQHQMYSSGHHILAMLLGFLNTLKFLQILVLMSSYRGFIVLTTQRQFWHLKTIRNNLIPGTKLMFGSTYL